MTIQAQRNLQIHIGDDLGFFARKDRVTDASSDMFGRSFKLLTPAVAQTGL